MEPSPRHDLSGTALAPDGSRNREVEIVDQAKMPVFESVGRTGNGPKYFGEVHVHGCALTHRAKARALLEVQDWVAFHFKDFYGDEIQYWVTFDRSSRTGLVNCKVTIIADSETWEGSESSIDPLRALQKCLLELYPESKLDVA
jgi:hypothetical protein